MKTLLISAMGALVLGAAWPTFAKPDFQAIERARRAQQAAQGEFQGASYQVSPQPAAAPLKCPPDRMELAIDRGARSLMPSPRAEACRYEQPRQRAKRLSQVLNVSHGYAGSKNRAGNRPLVLVEPTVHSSPWAK